MLSSRTSAIAAVLRMKKRWMADMNRNLRGGNGEGMKK
jgi:hypothetical protein